MVKLLDDSIGPYTNILMALTFVGIMYLVLKRSKVKVNLRQGMANVNPHNIRFKTVSDSTTHRGWNN